MPRVPILPTVTQNPAGGARYSAPGVVPVQGLEADAQRLSQQGQQTMQAGLQGVVESMRTDFETERRADIAQAEERLAASSEIDDQEHARFTTLQGLAAKNAFQAYRDDLAKRHKEMLDKAPNARQKDFLRESLLKRQQQLVGSALAHQARQVAVARVASAKTSTDDAVRRAIQFAGTEDEKATQNDVIAKAMELADLEGMDDTTRKAFVDSQLGRAVAGTVDKLLAEPGRVGELAAYWERNKGFVPVEQRTQIGQQVRGAFLDEQTRALDAMGGSLEQRMQVVGDYAAKNVITQDEATRARNYLMQLESQRLQVRAVEERAVRQQVDEWYAQNPMREPPVQLQQAMQRYGIRVQRTQVTDPAFVAELSALTPQQVKELRNAPSAIRENYLARRLSKEDAKTWNARILGDDSTVSTAERIKSAALDLKVIPRAPMNVESTEALNAWIKNTVEPAIERERVRLKVDKLLPAQVDELVLDPLRKQKAWVETGMIFKVREEVPLEQLVRTGRGAQANVTVTDDKTGRQTDVALASIPAEHVIGALEEWRSIGQPGSPSPEFVAEYWLDKGSPKAALTKATEEQKREAAEVLRGWPQFTYNPAKGPDRPTGLTPAAGTNEAMMVDQFRKLLQQQPK